MKVLIVGAGSIGNHLAQAARAMDWSVTVIDVDPEAIDRMKNETYPERYGAWDKEIDLFVSQKGGLPDDGYDMVMIGTPPDSHLVLAEQALELNPRILHIEKPLGAPLDDFDAFTKVCAQHPDVMVTVGYDHAIARSVQHAYQQVICGALGDVVAIDAFTREHWAGIFQVHPWLAGPHDSYLGYWERGGGALGEHSHALHLGLIAAAVAGWGKLTLQTAYTDIIKGEHGEEYDRASHLVLSAEDGSSALRVEQDVIVKPSIKGFRVVGTDGRLDVALSPKLDTVTIYHDDGEMTVREFAKTRPQDFLELMQHYECLLDGSLAYDSSPIRLEKGVEVMKFIQQTFGVVDLS